VLLAFIAVVGLGTSGTQILIYGFVATYYRTNVRSAGVAWCAGFGRLGGIGGPVIGGLLVASGIALNSIFYVLAALAVVGGLLTLVVPTAASRTTTSRREATRTGSVEQPAAQVVRAGQ
jgi:AAHS family benzoate transporter-like MFS transporter